LLTREPQEGGSRVASQVSDVADRNLQRILEVTNFTEIAPSPSKAVDQRAVRPKHDNTRPA
jgi:hypothetical protein